MAIFVLFFFFSFSYCVKSIVWTVLDITSLEIDCKKWQFDLHGCRAIVYNYASSIRKLIVTEMRCANSLSYMHHSNTKFDFTYYQHRSMLDYVTYNLTQPHEITFNHL